MEAIVRVPPSICPTLPKALGIRARNKRLKVLVLSGISTRTFGHKYSCLRAQTPMLSGTISESHLLRLNAMVTMMKYSPAFRRNYQVFLKKCLVFR